MKSAKLYRHIKDIMLDKFISLYCDNELSVLIISGQPSLEELEKAKENLISQYAESIGGNEYNARLEEVKEYIILQNKIKRAQLVLKSVVICGDFKELITELYKFQYRLPAYKDNLKEVLQAFEGWLKLDITNLQTMSNSFEGVGDSKDNTADQFFNMITDISELLKFGIDVKNTSVAQYCSYARKYKAKVEQLIKQQQKHER